jgi:hypothetical protein
VVPESAFLLAPSSWGSKVVADKPTRPACLRLKSPHAKVRSCRAHLDGLGFRIRRGGIEPLPATWERLGGRLGEFVRGTGRGATHAGLERSLSGAAGTLFFG